MNPSTTVAKSFASRSKALAVQAGLQQISAQRISEIEKSILPLLSVSPDSSSRIQLREQLNSLAMEGDVLLFHAGLLNLARALKADGEEGAAATLLEVLSGEGVPEKIRTEAKSELGAILGSGSASRRAEHLLSRLAHDATAHPTILSMLAGSVVGRTVGTAVLGRLAGSAHTSFMTRGFGARLAAGTASFAAEVPVFTLSSRALAGANAPFGEDLARAGLTLGALRLFGLAGTRIAPKAPQLAGQATAFLGLMTAHQAEVYLGLRPWVDGATTVTDALASLVSLGVGAHLGHKILGPGFARFQAEYRLRAANQDPVQASGEGGIGNSFLPSFAKISSPLEGGPHRTPPVRVRWEGAPKGRERGRRDVLMMVGSGESGGPPSSSSKIEVVDLPNLKGRLSAAKQEPLSLLPRITELMRIAFNDSHSPEIHRESGITLFREKYYRRWQEMLIQEIRPELEKLRPLSDEYLTNLAKNCLDALEAMIDRGEHVPASKLIGTLVYMVYRPKQRAPQKRFEEILLKHPHPHFRLAALIHHYPDLEVSFLRLLMWRQVERLLIFDDLASANPNRRSFAKSVLNFLRQAESDYGRHGSFIAQVQEALGNPEKLARLKEQFVPETAIQKAAVKEQVTGYFSNALVPLPPETRALYLHLLTEEIMKQVQSMSLLELREIFLEENFTTVVNGAPIKLMPAILSRQIRTMVNNGQMRITDAKVLISNLERSVAFLNSLFFTMGYIPKDYMRFVDPFTN